MSELTVDITWSSSGSKTKALQKAPIFPIPTSSPPISKPPSLLRRRNAGIAVQRECRPKPWPYWLTPNTYPRAYKGVRSNRESVAAL